MLWSHGVSDHFIVRVKTNMITYLVCILVFLYIFSRVTCGWCYNKVCLIGKTALITGGNTGIGYQTALALASRGCRIIIADKDDVTESTKKIISETKNPNVVAKHLDLASFASVRRFVEDIIKTEPRLDFLINNAGIASTGLKYTEDGLQVTMQVNYFGHFLLTLLLLDLLKKSAPSRIIFNSSIGAFFAKLKLENLNPSKNSPFNYSYSKLCQNIAAKCLAEKLRGTGVTAYSLHPGVVHSGIFWTAIKENCFLGPVIMGLVSLIFGKSTEEGAQTLVYLATDQDVEKASGNMFVDCHKFLNPFQVNNDKFCQDVWDLSKKYVKIAADECVF